MAGGEFTPSQEARIREMVREELLRVGQAAAGQIAEIVDQQRTVIRELRVAERPAGAEAILPLTSRDGVVRAKLDATDTELAAVRTALRKGPEDDR